MFFLIKLIVAIIGLLIVFLGSYFILTLIATNLNKDNRILAYTLTLLLLFLFLLPYKILIFIYILILFLYILIKGVK